jgi:TonB family protein
MTRSIRRKRVGWRFKALSRYRIPLASIHCPQRLIVGKDGHAQDVGVIRGIGYGLDEQAVRAIRTWRFKPAMKDGRAVPVYATIEVHFHL